MFKKALILYNFVYCNPNVAIVGLGSEKMDPAKIQNSGWSKENCGVGLYIFGGAIYRRGKVVEKLTLNKEDSHFGWLIQGTHLT